MQRVKKKEKNIPTKKEKVKLSTRVAEERDTLNEYADAATK
jgi:hypothetical protein